MNLTLYFDGAAEPTNPGVGTYGWIVDRRDGERIASGKGALTGRRTNNEAEYAALGFALRWLVEKRHPVGELLIMGDSQLVINQLTDRWQINKEHLRRLRDRCLCLLTEIGCQWRAVWISRESNKAADALSRQAYTEATGKPFPERKRKVRRVNADLLWTSDIRRGASEVRCYAIKGRALLVTIRGENEFDLFVPASDSILIDATIDAAAMRLGVEGCRGLWPETAETLIDHLREPITKESEVTK